VNSEGWIMEKHRTGLIGAIQKFSTEDGPGIRTTVFLKGCPLSCRWCHNPELIDRRRQLMHSGQKCIRCGACIPVCPQKALRMGEDGLELDRSRCSGCLACTAPCFPRAMNAVGDPMTVEQVMESVLQDRGFYRRTGGGVTISGGELLSQPEFADALTDACLEQGIPVVLDTSGYGDGDVLFALAKKSAGILYDMKLIEDQAHRRMTGVGNSRILENLERLSADAGIRAKIRMCMPLIRGVNDTEAVIEKTRRFYAEHHLCTATLLPYHALGIQKSRNIGRPEQEFEPPPAKRLHEIRDLFERGGIQTEILGEPGSGESQRAANIS